MSLCIVLLVISALVACHCESPAPYSPSGWRPSGPSLSLPSEYGPPPGVLPSASFVQLSQENVQFAGQTVEVPSGPASSSAYLPPSSPARFTAKFQRIQTAPNTNSDPLRVQQLPRLAPAKPFRAAPLLPRPQPARFRALPPSRNQNARILATVRQQQQQQQKFERQQSFSAEQPSLFSQKQQLPLPDTAYGSPTTEQPQPTFPYAPPSQFNPQTVDDKQPEDVSPEVTSTEEKGNDEPVIAVANAGSSGQYYILGKDNTLQRVVYETTQTEDDIENNGFTAQLKYEPVEPIRDPIYAYDDNGKLIRVYNKK